MTSEDGSEPLIHCTESLKKSKIVSDLPIQRKDTTMLLRFAVTNYLSIRDEAELMFIATPFKELRDGLIPSRHAKHGVLPALAIYGANASGKSNLISALAFMRSAVLRSFEAGDAESEMPHRPFVLNEENKALASTFVLDFVLRDIRYQYGFSATSQRVEEEWLFAYPKQAKQTLFVRNRSTDPEFSFGRGLLGSNRQIQSITRPNSLFLSVASKSAHPLLSEISSFFKNNISLRLSSGSLPSQLLAESLEEDDSLAKDVVRYLAVADTGIADIKIEKEQIPEEAKRKLEEFHRAMASFLDDKEFKPPRDTRIDIKLGHTSSDGIVRFLDFGSESLGTQYLFTILLPMLKALRNGTVLILDEITTSLHTLLSRRIVGIFGDRATNPHGAQLVFSTHDTNLLSPGVLRRDAIWFAEKSSDGSTHVYPLTDIKTKNSDNVEKGYVQGRFGAVPFLREIEVE